MGRRGIRDGPEQAVAVGVQHGLRELDVPEMGNIAQHARVDLL
jgi:hypothetical protein